MEFSDIMRACRKRSGLSQAKLAVLLRQDQSIISRIETGQVEPRMHIIKEWATVTDTTEVFVAYMYGQDALNAICKINQTVGA